MFGFEVAGLALGIVPLLITATEYYKSILHRLKHYSTERSRLEAGLLVQKGLFLTEISILLISVTNWDDAEIEEQLSLGYSSKCMTAEVDGKLQEHLGIFCLSVKLTMLAILEHLAFFETRTEKLKRVDSGNTQADLMTSAWFSAVMAKVSFSFSGKKFQERLSTLTLENQTLRNTLQQVKRWKKAKSQALVRPTHREAIHSSDEIRNAVSRVYNCLSYSCKSHRRHFAYFSLADLFAEGPSSLSAGIGMAFQPTLKKLEAKVEPPVRFVVRSISREFEVHPISDYSVYRNEPEGKKPPDQSIKRKRTVEPLLEGKENKKPRNEKSIDAVGGRNPKERAVLKELQSLSLEEDILQKTSKIPKDLSECGEFCRQIQSTTPDNHGLLGHLNINQDLRLQAFSPMNSASAKYPCTLSELRLTRSKSAYSQRLLPPEIMHLARQAALATSYFNRTSMLGETCLRETMVFFETHERLWYRRPYLKVALDHSIGTPFVDQTTGHGIQHSTFGLGCFLIEMAYKAPLSDLKEEAGVKDDETLPETRARIAETLSKSMVDKLGDSYMEVVRRCIDGERYLDLMRPEHQVIFVEDVISVLGRLEMTYAGIFL
ncbi:hypothetical protein B0J14DRAFT_644660 [Halenospora varia]|nr:hypothetical protein B0J14DRAFT_644660 [Halenospora varia]